MRNYPFSGSRNPSFRPLFSAVTSYPTKPNIFQTINSAPAPISPGTPYLIAHKVTVKSEYVCEHSPFHHTQPPDHAKHEAISAIFAISTICTNQTESPKANLHFLHLIFDFLPRLQCPNPLPNIQLHTYSIWCVHFLPFSYRTNELHAHKAHIIKC